MPMFRESRQGEPACKRTIEHDDPKEAVKRILQGSSHDRGLHVRATVMGKERWKADRTVSPEHPILSGYARCGRVELWSAKVRAAAIDSTAARNCGPQSAHIGLTVTRHATIEGRLTSRDAIRIGTPVRRCLHDRFRGRW